MSFAVTNFRIRTEAVVEMRAAIANEEEERRGDEVVVLFVRTESVLGEEYD